MSKIKVTFKTDAKAKTFAKNLASLSLPSTKASVDGKDVTLTVTDSDEEKMVRSLIKDVKEQFSTETMSRQLIESLSGCMVENKPRNLRMRDGSIVRLTSAQAKDFVTVHDQMSEENQTKIRRLVIESSESFAEIMEFCKQRSKTNGVV